MELWWLWRAFGLLCFGFDFACSSGCDGGAASFPDLAEAP